MAKFTFSTITSTVFFTEKYEVSIKPTETPTILEAVTSTDTLVTMVTAWVDPDAGVSVSSRPYIGADYYVEVSFTNCYSSSKGGISWIEDPVTRTRSLLLGPAVTGFLTPTRTIGSTALLNPGDMHPIDYASASYRAVPDDDMVCSRETRVVDYRSICETWFMTSPASTATVTRTRTFLNCGDMNPCCYGCHGWGYGWGFSKNASFYVCEDGREVDLEGAEMEGSTVWEHRLTESSSSHSSMSVFFVAGLAFIVAVGRIV